MNSGSCFGSDDSALAGRAPLSENSNTCTTPPLSPISRTNFLVDVDNWSSFSFATVIARSVVDGEEDAAVPVLVLSLERDVERPRLLLLWRERWDDAIFSDTTCLKDFWEAASLSDSDVRRLVAECLIVVRDDDF